MLNKSPESILINGTVKAIYTDQILEEYKNNPLIEALPPIYSVNDVIEKLTIDPGHNQMERQLDAHYRYHCIQRLFKYFQPLNTHIDIEQRISRAIRQGYLSRNPLGYEYALRLQQGYKMIKEGRKDFEHNFTARATASGFTIIGVSGVGKTTAVERILSLYPQVISHSRHGKSKLSLYQLTWMKIDCPYDGSLKGLCVNFFHEMDNLLGTNYYSKFATGKDTIDAMLPRMAQMANLHCLGVLVIDEIQHLSLAKSGGSDKMLNFFVTLVNTIGVPVILIGTTKAMSILQGEFRQARRGSGQGDLIWDRMKNDRAWEIMMKAMWKNQWTKNVIPLTDEIRNTIYDESQGIIDIAIKLYAMSQMKAIASGAETITPSTVKKVASEKLQLVRPMLDALKSGNLKEIAKYGDIRPVSIDDFKKEYEEKLVQVGENKKIPQNKSIGTTRSEIVQEVILKLLELDIEVGIAQKAVDEVFAKEDITQNTPTVVKEALRIALLAEDDTEDKNKKKVIQIVDKGDLRDAVDEGKNKKQSAYDSLKTKKMIKHPEDEF